MGAKESLELIKHVVFATNLDGLRGLYFVSTQSKRFASKQDRLLGEV